MSHSLSPRLHNAGYRTLGREALFVPFHVESFSDFWDHMLTGSAMHSLGMPIMGLTVASPHKEAALAAATKVSSIARGAGSANLLVRDNGYWRADTTDPDIVFMSSRERGVDVKQRRAAVIGCGGAGRAIAAALDQSGARVTLVNRGQERGSFAAQLLGLPYVPLLNFDAEGYHVVVNATPVGRDDDAAPFELETLADEAVVIDLVYGSRPTPLVSNSVGLGRTVIDGRDVLLTQVLRQFQIMTGREMSAGLARETLGQPVAKAGWTQRETSRRQTSVIELPVKNMETGKYFRAGDRAELANDGVDRTIDLAPFVGTWINTMRDTQGFVKLIVSNRDGKLFVQAFACCGAGSLRLGRSRSTRVCRSRRFTEGRGLWRALRHGIDRGGVPGKHEPRSVGPADFQSIQGRQRPRELHLPGIFSPLESKRNERRPKDDL